MTDRDRSVWIAGGAAVAAAVAAALAPLPPGIDAGQSGATRGFAGLAAAALVTLVVVPLVVWRSAWRRPVWIGLGVVALAAGVAGFAANRAALRTCTAQYNGTLAVIGTDLTAAGRDYVAANPALSKDELLFDSAGVATRLWTADSIERCRSRLNRTYFVWIPCLVACLFAAAQLMPSSTLSVAGSTRAPAPAARPGATPTVRYDVFISYRHGGRDTEFARDLLAALEREGYAVAIDERDFPANASFLQEMERCIRESRFTVSVISSRYLVSGHCEEEAILCKVLDMGDRQRRLIPMLIEPVELPAWLFGIVGIDCTKPDPLVDPFEKLRGTLGVPLAKV